MSQFHCLNNTSELEAVVAQVSNYAWLLCGLLATEVLVESGRLATEKVRFSLKVVGSQMRD